MTWVQLFCTVFVINQIQNGISLKIHMSLSQGLSFLRKSLGATVVEHPLLERDTIKFLSSILNVLHLSGLHLDPFYKTDGGESQQTLIAVEFQGKV